MNEESIRMSPLDKKCVLVIDGSLPLGVIANTAAMLAITIGQRLPQLVGADVTDASGRVHAGISTLPVSMLRGSEELLSALRLRLCEPEFAGLTVVDFSDVAQRIHVYEDYVCAAAETPERAHRYLGIAICGDKKAVSRLTGMLPLLKA